MLDPVAPPDCRACPRLADYIDQQRARWPDWHNGPVPSFGPITAEMLILGLAPGLRGANATGRPFTGDHAGRTLYQALLKWGWARGHYDEKGADDLSLQNLRIANAVRCVPPQNKPTGPEINQCRPFLSAELARMQNLRLVLALGRIAHETLLRHFGWRLADYPFGHNRWHRLPDGLLLLDSYHCSRYNTQTGRLTEAGFDAVFQQAGQLLAEARAD